ncbi:6-phosphofructokinase [Selenomonadales bacterium OttesenSCG-928-I06]|nr:6-phosphofructokinase [Selenomonadales bacterium OttesenSCG-928-I06]
MTNIRNIGIITSGGDCGGLNAVVRGAALVAITRGIGTYVIPNGYAGLYNLIDFNELVLLDKERVDIVNSSFAGSETGHSRVKISKIADENKYKRILAGLKKFNIDGLVISGGDDTGSVVVDLSENGIPCVHAPKTMDLDLQTYSVGGDSAINKIANIVNDIKTTGRTHNRIMIIEVFGRYAGHTAFRGGIASDADCILIPEIRIDFDSIYDHLKTRYMRRIETSDVRAGTYVIVVAEGILDEDGNVFTDEAIGCDSFGHQKLSGGAKAVRTRLEAKLKADPEIKEFMKKNGMYIPEIFESPEVRDVTPGHIIRSGYTFAYDVNFGKEVGSAAVLLLEQGITGVTVVGVEKGEIRYIPTKEAIVQRHVDLNMVSYYEEMGVAFGRRPVGFNPTFKKVCCPIERCM